MFPLKPLPATGITAALEKADRYRLLNEALEAESICLDVLEVEPDNQRALVTLLLALTDQFERREGDKSAQAQAILPRLRDEAARVYYEAIISERRAKVHLKRGGIGSGTTAFHHFERAMELYDRCIRLGGEKSAEATLRWNTCARILNRNPDVVPVSDEPVRDMLE